jgi:hypothetical protein
MTMPAAPNSLENLPPNYVQLLLGSLVLVGLLCIPLVVYTNHVKEEASSPSPMASAVGTVAPRQIGGQEATDGNPSFAQRQSGSIPADGAQRRSAIAASSLTSTSNRTGGNELAKSASGKRPWRKLASPAWGRSASPTLVRTWSRTISRRHAKASLIAIWHQSFRRNPTSKLKSSRS